MAQERCIKRCLDAGRGWEVGEIRTAMERGSSGAPVPSSPWWRLVEADEKISEADVFDPALVAEKRRESGQRDKVSAIRQALERLDPDNSRHWTSKGYPSLAMVQELSGVDVSRNEVVAAQPEFDREIAREQNKTAE